MTRKDYEAIANIFRLHRNLLDEGTIAGSEYHRGVKNAHNMLLQGILGVLATDNPKFDSEKFLWACEEIRNAHQEQLAQLARAYIQLSEELENGIHDSTGTSRD